MKALICLTDRYSDTDKESKENNEFTINLDGSFMVLAGSHHIEGRQSFLESTKDRVAK